MTRNRRQFTKEFKLHVIHELEAGKPLAQAGREHELHPNLIRKWQAQFAQYGPQAFAGNGKAYSDEAKIAELVLQRRFAAAMPFGVRAFRPCVAPLGVGEPGQQVGERPGALG